MSTRCTTLAWEHAPYKGSKLLVFLALCDFANREGLCWPSLRTVAAYARVEERYVRRCIREFEGDGLVACEQGGGRGKTSEYHVWPALKNEGLETRVPATAKPGFLEHEKGASGTSPLLTTGTHSSPARAGAREGMNEKDIQDQAPVTVEEGAAPSVASRESPPSSGGVLDGDGEIGGGPITKDSAHLSDGVIRGKMDKGGAYPWQVDLVLKSDNPTAAFYEWVKNGRLPDKQGRVHQYKTRAEQNLSDRDAAYEALERMKKHEA